MDKDSYRGYLIITIAVFTWSFSEIIVKLLQGRVGPLSLTFFRFFIGGIVMLILLIAKRDLTGIFTMLKENFVLFFLASFIALGISNIIYYVGVTQTKANIASTIYTTYPVWITIYSIFILNERSNLKLKFIGIIIGLAGVIILMTNFNFLGILSSQYLIGNSLVLLGSIIWSFYSVLGKKIQLNQQDMENKALKFSMLSMFFASIPVLFLLPFSLEMNTFLQYDLDSWFWIFILGIVSTGIGIFLLFEGIKYIEVSKAFSLAFLKPIFTIILAFLLLNELPTITLLISICLVMFSIILINKNGTKEDTIA